MNFFIVIHFNATMYGYNEGTRWIDFEGTSGTSITILFVQYSVYGCTLFSVYSRFIVHLKHNGEIYWYMEKA